MDHVENTRLQTMESEIDRKAHELHIANLNDGDKAISMNGAQLLVKTLEDNGVQYIFGVPGDIENEFFKELSFSKIKFITVRHEQAGAFMADVYARLTGKVGVCFSTLGPGATNLLTGVANAQQDRSAVLALSGQLPLDKLYPDSHQYIDLPQLFKPITKDAFMIQRARDIHADVSRAIALARAERQGPVHVTLPINIFMEDAEGYRLIQTKEETRFHYQDQLKRLYELMVQSRSMIAVVGNSPIRARACGELTRFLEKYEIPFYTTFQGKTALPYDHHLNCGTLSRYSKKAREILSEQDLVITVGYDVIEGVEPDIWIGAKHVVHIETATPGGTSVYRPKFEITGDLKMVLQELTERFERLERPTPDIDSMKIRIEAPTDIAHMFPMHPVQVMKDLSTALSSDDFVVSDVGQHKQFVGLYYNAEKPNRVIFSNGLSSMGFAIPAALAAKLVHPERNVIAVCGDGGFQMNVQELATAVEHKINVVFLIMNDRALGMVKKKQMESTSVTHCAEYRVDVNFAAIAKAYGAKGIRVKKHEEMIPALKEALNCTTPCVIDVSIQQYSEIQVMR